jgi:hypothetical protein
MLSVRSLSHISLAKWRREYSTKWCGRLRARQTDIEELISVGAIPDALI